MAITRDQIDRVLRLHRAAYEALVWLGNIALARPHMLDDETVALLRDEAACVAWVRRDPGRFPDRVRPAQADVGAFAHLFASFFQTSFRVERRLLDGNPYYRVVARKDEAAGKDRLGVRRVPRALERKRRDEAIDLRMRALVELAGSDQSPGFWDRVKELLADPTLRGHATLWAYACGLVRRAAGVGSDGPALHRLWLDMDRRTRQRLAADQVWLARAALLAAIGAPAGRGTATD